MLEGKRISGRYKVLEIIGGGGMSNVYLAHDMILNRDVAMKVLRYDFTNEAELHRRFQREALSVTSLTHPNIVNIYDVGEDGELHYIVMEYIKGKTLKQYIQENAPISSAKSVQIMKQLTSAIAHAHENGIIHRDIKPQNILMDENGNVKVTDFGIAMTLSATSFTQTNSVLGTVHYLSPEQARGGTATKQSDIYALGIVLYELLTGELPFSGESAVSIALKHLQSETPSVRSIDATIPQSLENVVLKATAKNPLHRYQSVVEMHRDLQTVLSAERLHEPKFTVDVDDEMTKAIPIIKEVTPIVPATAKHPSTEEKKIANIPEKIQPSKAVSKKKWPIFLGGGMIALMLLVGILLVATNIFSPKKIDIPDLKNTPLEEGIQQLKALGFEIGEQREVNDDEIDEGFLVGTDPEAGKSRVKGTEIDLLVSIGAGEIDVNDYTGKSYSQIEKAIKSIGFSNIKIVEQYANTEVGTIIAQQPIAGEKVVAKKTELVLTISKGKNLIAVTNIKGYTQSALTEYEKSSGFHVKVVEEQFSEDIPAGSVISQSPAAGKQLEEGSTIEVVLSKGPPEKPVKMYIKTITIPYEPTEPDTEQTVLIYIQDNKNTMAEPFEEMKIGQETSYQISLEIAEGEKAAYRIVRDSIVIAEETKSYGDLE